MLLAKQDAAKWVCSSARWVKDSIQVSKSSNSFPWELIAVSNITTLSFLCWMQFLEFRALRIQKYNGICQGVQSFPWKEKNIYGKTNYIWWMLVMVLIALLAQSPPGTPLHIQELGWIRHPVCMYVWAERMQNVVGTSWCPSLLLLPFVLQEVCKS